MNENQNSEILVGARYECNWNIYMPMEYLYRLRCADGCWFGLDLASGPDQTVYSWYDPDAEKAEVASELPEDTEDSMMVDWLLRPGTGNKPPTNYQRPCIHSSCYVKPGTDGVTWGLIDEQRERDANKKE